jgi:hypothetical protein
MSTHYTTTRRTRQFEHIRYHTASSLQKIYVLAEYEFIIHFKSIHINFPLMLKYMLHFAPCRRPVEALKRSSNVTSCLDGTRHDSPPPRPTPSLVFFFFFFFFLFCSPFTLDSTCLQALNPWIRPCVAGSTTFLLRRYLSGGPEQGRFRKVIKTPLYTLVVSNYHHSPFEVSPSFTILTFFRVDLDTFLSSVDQTFS